MASEERRFAFADVVDGITRKMVRRHPHVFGEASRDEFLTSNAKFLRRFATVEEAGEGRAQGEDATLEEMDQLWDEAKAAERKI